jgi:hypothetical protein
MAKKKIIVENSSSNKPSTNDIGPASQDDGLLFGKKNYMIVLAGLALMFIGFILMSGGHMPSRDVWDPNIIYSPVRMTVAPLFILAGLSMQIYAIFAKK